MPARRIHKAPRTAEELGTFIPRLRLREEKRLHLLKRGREFITGVSEHDRPSVIIPQHVAAVLRDLPKRLVALHQTDAVPPPKPLHATLKR